ncbi:MAG TPA: transposase [bacterium]
MPYPPRVCFDGAVYHVTTRGNNRHAIFIDEQDFRQALLILLRYKQRFHFILHAYALMPNHLHLLIQPSAGSTISKIMQCMMITYTKHFNRRHERVGHVMQGRFHSRLIQDDTYLLVASRYIHLNPVRAGLVSTPGAYPWSSYPAYELRAHNPLDLVDTELVLGIISPQRKRQRRAYRDFVLGPNDPVSDTYQIQI